MAADWFVFVALFMNTIERMNDKEMITADNALNLQANNCKRLTTVVAIQPCDGAAVGVLFIGLFTHCNLIMNIKQCCLLLFSNAYLHLL